MKNCPDCQKWFPSDQALQQHFLAKHGSYLCTECLKSFHAEQSLLQHSDSKHSASKRRTKTPGVSHCHDDPYPGIEGYWIDRDKYRGTSKSFGWFECNSCSKTWFSAHSQKRYKQGCQECDEESYPCCLWVNTNSFNESSKVPKKEDGPHDRARCEACRRGQCMDSSKFY